MKLFSFPVWVLVNSLHRREDGSPFFLIHGGHDTGMTPSLSVFSSQEKAERLVDRHPFLPVKMDWQEFYLALLAHHTEIQQIIFNIGSPEAVGYTVEEALNLLRQDPTGLGE